MSKPRRPRRPPSPFRRDTTEGSAVTKLDALVMGELASRVRAEVAEEARARADHVKSDDASARTRVSVGPDGIPLVMDDDDFTELETTRVSAPSRELLHTGSRRSSRPAPADTREPAKKPVTTTRRGKRDGG